MPRFVKKPIPVELEQFEDVSGVLPRNVRRREDGSYYVWNELHKSEINIVAGDWINVSDPNDTYPIAQKVFAETYAPYLPGNQAPAEGFGEGKYGSLSNVKLRDGEPWFILRAQDVLAPAAVDSYALALEAASNGIACYTGAGAASQSLHDGALEVAAFGKKMRDWQIRNVGFVKLPD